MAARSHELLDARHEGPSPTGRRQKWNDTLDQLASPVVAHDRAVAIVDDPESSAAIEGDAAGPVKPLALGEEPRWRAPHCEAVLPDPVAGKVGDEQAAALAGRASRQPSAPS